MLFEAQRYTPLRKEKVKENVQFLFVFFSVPAAVAPSTFCRFSKVVCEGPTTEPSRSLMCSTRNEIFCDHMERFQIQECLEWFLVWHSSCLVSSSSCQSMNLAHQVSWCLFFDLLVNLVHQLRFFLTLVSCYWFLDFSLSPGFWFKAPMFWLSTLTFTFGSW